MREMARPRTDRPTHAPHTHAARIRYAHNFGDLSPKIGHEIGLRRRAHCPAPQRDFSSFFWYVVAKIEGAPVVWYKGGPVHATLTTRMRHYTLRHIPHTPTVRAGSRLVLVLLQ